MKPQELDFRVWSKLENRYIEDPALAKLGSVLPAKVHRADKAIPFIKFDERDDEKEIEFYTGYKDKNNTKIYEGDIVHIKPNNLEDFIDFIDFRKDKGYFLGAWGNDDDWIDDDFCKGCCQVIGNIHENKELIDFMERQDNEWKLFYKRKDEDWLDFLRQKHKDFVAEEEFFNKKYCDLETKLRLKLEQELKEILSRYL